MIVLKYLEENKKNTPTSKMITPNCVPVTELRSDSLMNIKESAIYFLYLIFLYFILLTVLVGILFVKKLSAEFLRIQLSKAAVFA